MRRVPLRPLSSLPPRTTSLSQSMTLRTPMSWGHRLSRIRCRRTCWRPLMLSRIANFRTLDEKLPAQSRLIENLRNRLELDKRELAKRDKERKRLTQELDNLRYPLSFSSLAAALTGGVERKQAETRIELDRARKSDATVRSQVSITSQKLSDAIEEV
ncbi:hypothetical protein DFJ73DRAFT_281691 [Zopfochytrium polystomum]|nr:hypothetical protein DFJ73DRAFT_281691 [Zopfochytrium polystomum]